MSTTKEFLAGLQNENANIRYKTWIQADKMDAEVVSELGKLLDSENPGIAKAAGEAMRILVHDAARVWDGAKRTQVMEQLLALLTEETSLKAKVQALRFLSTMGDSNAVSAVAKQLRKEELREEALYCLERIPGKEAEERLMRVLDRVPEGYKPRIQAVLDHRTTGKRTKFLQEKV